MLFSRPEVREVFRSNDVLLAWEGVRPVPTVTIDFGNGRTLKRTINGNIAFYVCAPDGRVVHISPGLHSPEAFVEELKEGLGLVQFGPEQVAAHHRRGDPAVRGRRIPDASKIAVVERPVHRAIAAPSNGEAREILTEVEALEADTRHNRAVRKPKVRRLLSGAPTRPGPITRRVYKEILDCDLDDPYLGLSKTLFGGGAYGARE